MSAPPEDTSATSANSQPSLRAERCGKPRWARWLRRVLLCLIGLLYVASVPWYWSDSHPARLLGLPGWVAVAILCYVAAAVLNSLSWLLTEIEESTSDDEGPES